MKFTLLLAALATAVPVVLAANLTVNTPASVVTCEPTSIDWSGGTGPYYPTVLPGGQSAAAPIKQFPTQTGTSLTWTVDILQGTSITIAVKDSTGSTAYTSIITIQAGTTTSCVNSSVQETGSSGSSPATTGGSGSSPATATTTATSTATGSSASSTSSTQSSGAGRVSAASAFGVAGIMGLIGASLF